MDSDWGQVGPWDLDSGDSVSDAGFWQEVTRGVSSRPTWEALTSELSRQEEQRIHMSKGTDRLGCK